MAREVVIVPHTHWDREWYAPFQTFRLRLVELLDQLLDLLDADPGYAHFMLDGQMAVVDDYLAMRPHERDRLRRLATAGRLGMGPWYVLMDEFLVSGETIIRDLQLGLDRAAAFGGAAGVGYLPDMFGHIAQMPQLLAHAGFEHAVVWRGVPAAVDRTGFWWEAPDGSRVRARYLPDGYGNGASLPADAKDLVAAIDRFATQHGDLIEGPIVWMNGTDHLLPQPWLGRVVAEANAVQDDYHLRVGSIADAATAAPDPTRRWTGELRSGSRANLLMGVASNRVDVKQAAATAERWIERCAEPLSALFLPAAEWPGPFLDEAWTAMIRNAAHDSSCACSHDDVGSAVLVRYQEARHIGQGLTERVVSRLAGLVDTAGPIVVNPSARIRSGAVAVSAPGHEAAPGTQRLRLGGGDEVTAGVTVAEAALRVQTVLDSRPDLAGGDIELGADGVLDIRLCHDPDTQGPRYDGPVLAEVRAAAERHPDGPARITLTTPARHDALVPVTGVPGFGWAPVVAGGPEPVVVTDRTVTNGLVTVAVAPDGTFSLADDRRSVSGLGRLVDGGDAGDTYNYNPPGDDVLVTEPDEVVVRVIEDGPVRARLAVDRRYTWPVAVEDDRRVGSVAVATTTTIEVVAGSPLVRLTTELDNRARDHRLRVWFPLPDRAERSVAECAFAVVERTLDAEGGPTEHPLATFPSRRFVCAGGLTVVHEGLPEYEVVDIDDDGVLALTLLRCTGVISRGPMTYRPLPAGPPTPTPAAQMPGRHVLRYGVQLGDDPGAAYAAVDDAFLPLFVARAAGGGPGPNRGSVLDVSGAEVSAVIRDGGGQLVVRLFNPTDRAVTARLAGRRGWLVDLRGRAGDPFEEVVDLGPWQIATLVVSEG